MRYRESTIRVSLRPRQDSASSWHDGIKRAWILRSQTNPETRPFRDRNGKVSDLCLGLHPFSLPRVASDSLLAFSAVECLKVAKSGLTGFRNADIQFCDSGQRLVGFG